MCFGCSKEPSHREGSFEYPQHIFWLRNKKNNFQLRTLIWGPGNNSEIILKTFIHVILKVVEWISRAIADTMEAEFTSLRDTNGHSVLPETTTFTDWEKQTYLQSGSLLAKSCESALELSGHKDQLKSAAAEFGENIAYARQVTFSLLSCLCFFPETVVYMPVMCCIF